MSEEFTREEAIKRYGDLMVSYGKLQEQERNVRGLNIYAEFPEADEVLGRIKTYRELTGENFPNVLETVNPDLNELEMLCKRLFTPKDESSIPF